jgi:hypothetical protein
VDPLDDLADAAYVQKGFLLAGETRFREVFRGCRRAHGDRNVPAARHFIPRSADFSVEPGLQRRRHDPLPDLRAGGGQFLHVIHVQVRQRLANPLCQALLGHEVPVGGRRGRETIRDPHPKSFEVGEHFPERSVLAADALDIGHPEFI